MAHAEGDERLTAATPASIEEFKGRVAPPEMPGDEAIAPLEEAHAARSRGGPLPTHSS